MTLRWEGQRENEPRNCWEHLTPLEIWRGSLSCIQIATRLASRIVDSWYTLIRTQQTDWAGDLQGDCPKVSALREALSYASQKHQSLLSVQSL